MMKIIGTIVLTCYAAVIAYAAENMTTLDEGIYEFQVVAHKQGREKPYNDPPVDCDLKMDGQSFTLVPTTNMEWTAKGTISNNTVSLTFERENMDKWIQRGFRFEYIGTITEPNHVKGTHEGYAGTNKYLSGTWELMKKGIQQGGGAYPPPAARLLQGKSRATGSGQHSPDVRTT